MTVPDGEGIARLANEFRAASWRVWSYDGDRDALVLVSAAVGERKAMFICWHPKYARVPGLTCENVKFLDGSAALTLVNAHLSNEVSGGVDEVIVMRDGTTDFFCICTRVEFRITGASNE